MFHYQTREHPMSISQSQKLKQEVEISRLFFFFFWTQNLSFQISRHTLGHTSKTERRKGMATDYREPLSTASLLPARRKTAVDCICLKLSSSFSNLGKTGKEQKPFLGKRVFSCMCRDQNHMVSVWPWSMNLKPISESLRLVRGTQ